MSDLVKDPDAVLPFTWDFAYLWAGTDAVVDHEVFTAAGTVVVGATSHDGTTVTAWLSGGTAGEVARVTARATTSKGRVDDRSITLRVAER